MEQCEKRAGTCLALSQHAIPAECAVAELDGEEQHPQQLDCGGTRHDSGFIIISSSGSGAIMFFVRTATGVSLRSRSLRSAIARPSALPDTLAKAIASENRFLDK